jgi:hypothetical protein
VTAGASRRHATLIATAARLIAEVAQAVAALYEPMAATPERPVPGSGPELHALAAGAADRLDAARARDRQRWPDAAGDEATGGGRHAVARAILAEVETLLDGEPVTAPVTGPVPAPAPVMAAALAPTEAATELVTHTGQPPTAVLVRRIAARHALGPQALLDEAIALHAGAACLALQEAARRVATDPAGAGGTALAAIQSLAAAVTLATIDPAEKPR